MKNSFTIALKWGALLGVALSLLQLAKVYSRDFDFYAFGPVITLFNVLLFIAILYLGIKEIKEDCYDGIISFAKAFLQGTIMVFVAFFVVLIYLNIQYGVIFKDELPKINKLNKEKFKENLLKDSLTNEEFESVLISQLQVIKSEKEKVILNATIDSINRKLISNRLDTVYQYYTHFVRSQRDSVEFFKLGNFDQFSKEVWMDVLGKYLTTLPKNDSMAPFLNTIISNSIQKYATISPLTTRYEKEKAKIPQYTNSFSAALFYSFSVIIFGILFNIFVAMYLYDRKKRVEQEDQIEENESEISNETENKE